MTLKKKIFLLLILLLVGCNKNITQIDDTEKERIYFISESEQSRNIYILDIVSNEKFEFSVDFGPNDTIISLPIWCESTNSFYATFSDNSNSDIYSFDRYGKNLKNLSTTSNIFEFNPVCSPNGEWIAYERFETKSDIWLMDKNGKNLRNLTEKYPQNFSPIWSADSSTIYFSSLKEGSPNIYRITLTGDLLNVSKGSGVDGTFTLSPDSTKLAFDSDRDGNFDIFLLDLVSEKIKNLTSSKEMESEPIFSPNGKMILYKIHSNSNFDYAIFDLTTQSIRKLTNYPNAYKGNAIWNKDSSMIFFSMKVGKYLDIFSADIISNEMNNLTNTSEINEFSPLLVIFPID